MDQGLFTYSWRIGRLWQTEIRVHWMLAAALIFFAMRFPPYAFGGVAPWLLLVILPWLLLFGSVLLHEFGHVFAARNYRIPAGEIILTPIGGLALIGARSRTPKIEFVIAAAGPAVNVVLAGLALVFYLTAGGPIHLGLVFPLVDSRPIEEALWLHATTLAVVHDFIQMQAFLVLFNVCVAAYPMDGGRMLMAALWSRTGHGRAMYLSLKVAQVLALFMAAAALAFGQPVLILIAFVIFIQAALTLQQLPHIPDPSYDPDPRFEYLAWEQRQQREQQARKIKRPSPLRRWLNRRKARREMQRVEQQLTTRQRVDELLDKITREGISSLTDEERAYLKQASRQYQGTGSGNRPS